MVVNRWLQEILDVVEILEEHTEPVRNRTIQHALNLSHDRVSALVKKLTYLDPRLYETDNGKYALNSHINWNVDSIIHTYFENTQHRKKEKSPKRNPP